MRRFVLEASYSPVTHPFISKNRAASSASATGSRERSVSSANSNSNSNSKERSRPGTGTGSASGIGLGSGPGSGPGSGLGTGEKYMSEDEVGSDSGEPGSEPEYDTDQPVQPPQPLQLDKGRDRNREPDDGKEKFPDISEEIMLNTD